MYRFKGAQQRFSQFVLEPHTCYLAARLCSPQRYVAKLQRHRPQKRQFPFCNCHPRRDDGVAFLYLCNSRRPLAQRFPNLVQKMAPWEGRLLQPAWNAWVPSRESGKPRKRVQSVELSASSDLTFPAFLRGRQHHTRSPPAQSGYLSLGPADPESYDGAHVSSKIMVLCKLHHGNHRASWEKGSGM